MARMGRKRKTNKHLPARVYPHHGSYRYVPIEGPPITLAKIGDLAGMYRALADITGQDNKPMTTLGSVMDRYLREVTPGKCADSVRKEPGQMAKLKAVFGHFRPGQLNHRSAYRYIDKRSLKAPVAAVREIELLRHVCTMAYKWSSKWPPNPLTGIELTQPKKRDRYVENDEYISVWESASPMIQCAMDLAMLTGLRRGDLLALTRANITDDGLLVTPSKTQGSSGESLLFEMTSALKEVLSKALAIQPQVRQSILCNTQGKRFNDRTFDGAWQRAMRKHIEAGGKRFQFKDLRKKSATDESDEVVASRRLGHSSQRITNQVYRLKPRRVKPLR